MLSYDGLSKKPEMFRSFSGLDVSEFDEVYDVVESRYPDFERKRLSRDRERKNEIGGGRPFKLELEDRLLMLLVYLPPVHHVYTRGFPLRRRPQHCHSRHAYVGASC